VKVILAEDSDVTRLLMEAVLRQDGHEVIAVPDGAAAWQAYTLASAPLVILDWMMPNMDGIEVCRRIRATDAGEETFILLLTGRGTSEDLTTALDAGVDDFVAKPVPAEVLQARVVIAERRIGLDRARRAAEDALSRAQWLAGIGEAVLTMQHEINNPLAALMAEIDLMADDSSTVEAQRPPLDRMKELARRISTVIRRLAKLEQPESVEYLAGVRMLDISNPPSR
jgi:DNA-binding response OmpR family regulator